MFCSNCGSPLNKKDKFCSKCGFKKTDNVQYIEEEQIKPIYNNETVFLLLLIVFLSSLVLISICTIVV